MQRINDVLDIPVPKSDFSCPIESGIFFEPVMTVPCLHIFENHGLEKWLAKHKTCPDCNGEVREVTVAPPVFKNTLEYLLKKYPELNAECNFHLAYLRAALKLARDGKSIKLENIIQFLKLSNKLNEFSNEEGYKNTTAFYWLCDQHDMGIKYLTDDLCDAVSVESLNKRLDNGDSALAWLASCRDGVSLLAKHAGLREKITAETLNAPDGDNNEPGKSPLYYLTLYSRGVQLICQDDILKGKVTREGLNRPVRTKNGAIRSALSHMAEKADGRKLLCKDAIIRGKVTQEGLDTVQSDISWLVLDREGRELLSRHESLRAKITADGFNELNEDDHTSFVYHLLLHHAGQEMVLNDHVLRGKITAQGLNAVRGGQDGGESAVYELCKHHVGRKTLLRDERLSKLITAETLQTTVGKDGNKTAAYWLLNTPEGNELLEKDPELRGKISADRLVSVEVAKKEVANTESVNQRTVPVEAANPYRLFSSAAEVQKPGEAPVNASADAPACPPVTTPPPTPAFGGYHYPNYQNPSPPAPAYYNYYYPGYQNPAPAPADYNYCYPTYPKP